MSLSLQQASGVLGGDGRPAYDALAVLVVEQAQVSSTCGSG